MTDANGNQTKEDLLANTPDESSYDAEQLREEIEAGEQEAPQVNVDADYQRAQQYATAGVEQRGDDRTQDAANTDAFRKMAKEVNRNLQ